MAERIATVLRSLITARVGSGPSPQALQAGLPSFPETDSIETTAETMVAGGDRRLAEARTPGGA
jgi:hypothetical protein